MCAHCVACVDRRFSGNRGGGCNVAFLENLPSWKERKERDCGRDVDATIDTHSDSLSHDRALASHSRGRCGMPRWRKVELRTQQKGHSLCPFQDSTRVRFHSLVLQWGGGGTSCLTPNSKEKSVLGTWTPFLPTFSAKKPVWVLVLFVIHANLLSATPGEQISPPRSPEGQRTPMGDTDAFA